MTATRTSDIDFSILGGKITPDDAVLKGLKLPTNKQVIRCMKYHQQFEDLNQWESAEAVLKQVKLYYAKANLEDRLIKDKGAKEKLLRYLKKDNLTRKPNTTLRQTKKFKDYLKEHEEFLNKTFIITQPDALSKPFQFDADRLFLVSMLEDRTATLGSHDRSNLAKIKQKHQKEDRLIQRKNVASTTARMQFEMVPSEIISGSSSASDSARSEEDVPSGSKASEVHRRKVKSGALLEVPYDILARTSVVEVMTRCGISPASGSALLQSIITASTYSGQEDLTNAQLLSKFSLSYASCDRYKRKMNYQMAEIIKENWTPPLIYNIHWDSKLVPEFTDKYKRLDIMPVLVSCGSETKLLGVPSFSPEDERSIGSIIGDVTHNLLCEWNCSVDGAASMVFDTTSTNTGLWSGGCVELQRRLNKPLLWCACRKHIGELIVGGVFESLQIETSRSPEISMFKNFRTYFSHISQDNLSFPPYLNEFDCPSSNGMDLLNELQTDATDLATQLLTKSDSNDIPREDYRELLQLLLFSFQSPLPHMSFKFKKPGAIHKARWMAKVIYAVKLSLLSTEAEKVRDPANDKKHLILQSKDIKKLKRFAMFILYVYVPWWFRCSSSISAPRVDLTLIKTLHRYKQIDSTVASSALKKLQLHMWYLTEEMVPLSLFDDDVAKEDKMAIAETLLKTEESSTSIPKKRKGNGKPSFPPLVNQDTSLADLTGEDSWYYFKLLSIETEFKKKDVEDWPHDEQYLSGKNKSKMLTVVNDCAERGVKLAADFISTVKAQSNFANTVQVVENSRCSRPNLRKRPHT